MRMEEMNLRNMQKKKKKKKQKQKKKKKEEGIQLALDR
jgi:hypothetical protein